MSASSFPTWEIGTSDWGPVTWQTLHYLTFCFPLQPTEEDRARYRAFFASFAAVIPCTTCAGHFRELLDKYPIDLRSRDHLVRWLIRCHNDVNHRLGKSVLTETEIVAAFRHRPATFTDGLLLGAGLVCLVGLLRVLQR